MNYYERHIGDYLKDTAHLSLLEHGVYGRLLDLYYTREAAIPDAQVARLIGARSKDELAAMRAVLSEFFVQEEGGDWVQMRCEREISRYQDKQRKASASANARWNKPKPHSDGNANAPPYAMRTHSEGNAPMHQTPDTIPNTAPNGAAARATPAGSLCLALKAAGISRVAPGNQRLVTLLEAGATEAEFMAHVPKALEKGGDAFAYLLGIVEGERKRALSTAGTLPRGAMPNKQEAVELRNSAVGDAWVEKMQRSMREGN